MGGEGVDDELLLCAVHVPGGWHDPAESHISLADGELSAHELSNLELGAAWLAYLSACTTAFGGTRLLDEAIHLASALHTAGVPHVVATLWQVPDTVALGFAKQIYPQLDKGTPPALAVHLATRAARERYRDDYSWAAHLHFGP